MNGGGDCRTAPAIVRELAWEGSVDVGVGVGKRLQVTSDR